MLDFDGVKQSSVGRWTSIFRALGISVREDGKHGPCPACEGKDRFRFDDKDGRGTYFCNSCGAGDGFELVQKVLGIEFKEAIKAVGTVVGNCEKNAIPKEKKITQEQLRKIFAGGSKATSEDLVGIYLKNRGLSVVPRESLWFSRDCWESETKKEHNAMLGVFQMPDGKAVCVHRTYLSPDAEKLDIKSPKKITPALVDNISGGAIRLFETDGDILGVAEGIETAIAAHEDLGIPVWSCVNSTLMENFVPPNDVKHIVVIADNDKNFAGQKSAYVLANRIRIKYKKDATVYVPLEPGQDWLDVIIKQKKFNQQNNEKRNE